MAFRPVTVGMVCAAAITVAGCSSGVSATGAASTASALSQGAPAAQALTLAASEARHITSFTATLQIRSTGSLATTLSGTLRMQTKPSMLTDQNFHVNADGQGLPGGVETLLTSSAAYLKIDTLARVLGKPWVKVSIAGLRNSSGINLIPLVQQVESGNPLAQVQMFTAAKDVRKVGTQDVNGTQTTEYMGSYRIADGLAKLDPSLLPVVGPSLKATGISATQFKVWIDSQHQVRQMILIQSGKSIRVASVMVVTAVNQPVNIHIPAASQVASAPEIP